MKGLKHLFCNLLSLLSALSLVHGSGYLRTFDDICTWDNGCDHSKFLICLHGKCQCANPSAMTFSQTLDSCVTQANESCHLEETWNRGSGHSNHGNGPPGEYILSNLKVTKTTPCVADAFCDEKTQKCVCSTAPGGHGNCMPSNSESPLLQSCDYDQNKCLENSGLKCVNGRCQCGINFFQYFNGSVCLSRAGGPCQKDGECTPNSECANVNGGHRCKCSSGFTKNKLGRCAKAHGQSCDLNVPCSDRGPLACVDGKCQCADDLQYYSEYWGTCKGLVGARCPHFRGDKYYCVGDAVCSTQIPGAESFGVCSCYPPFKETSDHGCGKRLN